MRSYHVRAQQVWCQTSLMPDREIWWQKMMQLTGWRIWQCKHLPSVMVCVRIGMASHQNPSRLLIVTPPPVGGQGIVFVRFLSFFLSLSATVREKTAGPICTKFSGKVWNDHGTIWSNFGSIRVNGLAGQRSISLLSPVIAQRTGVNKSVSFARWQQGAGFVVPRTTACFFLVQQIRHWNCWTCVLRVVTGVLKIS